MDYLRKPSLPHILLALVGGCLIAFGWWRRDVIWIWTGIACWSLWQLRVDPHLDRFFKLAAAFMVALCLFLPPLLSDDYHRFLWEGFAANRGYSPYLWSPESLYPKLDHPSEGHVNHPQYSAIYPPLAQILFRLADFIGSTIWHWKWILVGLFFALLGLAKASGENLSVLWWCSPIVLIEGFWNAHLDLLGLPLGLLLLGALKARRGTQVGFIIAILTCLKIIPVVLFPYCWLALPKTQRVPMTLSFLLLLMAVYAPYLDQWQALFDSFLVYSKHWYFNNPIFMVLSSWIGASARTAMAGGLALVLLVRLWRPGPIEDVLGQVWLAVLVLSPTVYPWYILWLAPFVKPQRLAAFHLGYLFLCLSYFVLGAYWRENVWSVSWWWLLPEWLCLVPALTYAVGLWRPDAVVSARDTGYS